MNYAELKRALREIVGDMSNLPISGTVTAVDGYTCTIQLGSGLEITEIRLAATNEGGNNFLMCVPKVGTKAVAIEMRGDLTDLLLVRANEYEKILYSQDGLNFEIDSTDGKVSISNNAQSLHTLMGDLCTLLTNFKVNTPAGPSVGLLPDSLAAVQQLEQGLNMILK